MQAVFALSAAMLFVPVLYHQSAPTTASPKTWVPAALPGPWTPG